jgi:S1-C subfamily serine protease
MIVAGKHATALVDVNIPLRRDNGSAFCVHPLGYFVTNAHVVEYAKVDGDLKLVIDAGESSQRVVDARVLRVDSDTDLALLQLNKPIDGLVALEIGSSEDLLETMPIVVFGYPFGIALAGRSQPYPSITVSTGQITALQKINGDLSHIQLNASVNPGNSGGPVLDKNGKVIGVIQAYIKGAGVDMAIPAAKLAGFLDTIVLFKPPAVSHTRLHDPVPFDVTVVSFRPSTPVLKVELELTAAGWSSQKLSLLPRGYVYHIDSPVLPPPARGLVRLTARFPNRVVSGTTADAPVHVGTRSLNLSALSLIMPGGAPVILADGSEYSGIVTGLGNVTIRSQTSSDSVDLSKALRIDVLPLEPDPNGIDYKITVSRGPDVVTINRGVMAIGP